MRCIIQNLMDSASSEGCSDDLVVVGAAELQALRDMANNKYRITKMDKTFCPACGNNVRLLAEDRMEIAFYICDCGRVGQIGVSPINRPSLWDMDVIQFARLIAEMGAIGIPDSLENWEALRENMDLSKDELYSLFERAQLRWDAAVAQLTKEAK